MVHWTRANKNYRYTTTTFRLFLNEVKYNLKLILLYPLTSAEESWI